VSTNADTDDIDAFLERNHLPHALRGEIAALAHTYAGRTGTHGEEATIELEDLEEDEPTAEAAPVAFGLPARYLALGALGHGGMGQVLRVRDRQLGRTCALKLLRRELVARPMSVARFTEEAQLAAQLQHPNLLPVYDAGRLADGRVWFTMKEVRGSTLSDEIVRAHQARSPLGEGALRRLVGAFAAVCDGVGYAHARGVVHRDLKPENVMIGAHGEVVVLDWGIARLLGRVEGDEEPELRVGDRAEQTRLGRIMGTPAYMAPEQAWGRSVDRRADVWSLGAMLFEILVGRRPYRGSVEFVIASVREADEPRIPAGAPDDLRELQAACMSRDPSARPNDAMEVASHVRAFLDGATRRERARTLLHSARASEGRVQSLRADAAHLRDASRRAQASLAPWEPEPRWAEAWAMADRADALEAQSANAEHQRESLLRAALAHAPDLIEASADLLDLALAHHREAESVGARRAVARAESVVRERIEPLPVGHASRARAEAWLAGVGTLLLLVDPPDARVELLRHVEQNRRFVEVPHLDLGPGPVAGLQLPMGSWLARLSAPGRETVRMPFRIGRQEVWDGVPPGRSDPRAIRLPAAGELGPDDVFVPAGWFWSGGDDDAVEGLPARRLWCEDVVVRRFPVTNAEYIRFLDDLVASGREDEALRHAPRERTPTGDGPPVYGRGPDGCFVLRRDADGDLWEPDWPVILVDWAAACAFARWEAARTGRPWRPIGEYERERVARGADGRAFPWGNGFLASWCCGRASREGRALPSPVHAYPVDASPYGVRGLAGNVKDWCSDVFRLDGPPLDGQTVLPPGLDTSGAVPAGTWVTQRGGFWDAASRRARAASRARGLPETRDGDVGIRLAYRPLA
jgi:formylglycine-generating enzyme required for sulfatase activity/tRNA A-37 threonylcarbamoyl transferase component Bud32